MGVTLGPRLNVLLNNAKRLAMLWTYISFIPDEMSASNSSVWCVGDSLLGEFLRIRFLDHEYTSGSNLDTCASFWGEIFRRSRSHGRSRSFHAHLHEFGNHIGLRSLFYVHVMANG